MKILITGATSGIGKQLALDYAAEGHDIIAVGRNPDALSELAANGIRTISVDLTDRQAVLASLSGQSGLHLAILNAGTCEYLDMPVFDSAAFSRVLRANVESMAHCIEAVLPALRQTEGARLVGVASAAAFVPLPRAEAYGASKAAIRYLLDTLDITLAPFGVAVTSVFPGFVKTPLTDKNDFPMPMQVSVQAASVAIRRGIEKGQRHIHFPKPFTWPLKVLGLLPQHCWRLLAKRISKS
ncbi:SDR family NAD(P)-dependent oxidoreductase [Gallaecimonas mangrovi]|uniref:SDR family NAD(P)-dependent oxidoreductase n=1 Tax=Gallaecimonas mangrovi TaxID=2291597 RepID=UPI000E1FBDA9|nr:SDR family NAD(P)-dependent oxidoreductase [Gallaecimonas mangrovi]